MKGIDLSRQLFEDWALPLLNEEFPLLVPRIAAAASSGSQAIGADDEFSRDHGWGPRFDLVLNDLDYKRDGEAVNALLQANLPAEFMPVERKVVWEQQTIAVAVVSERARTGVCYRPAIRADSHRFNRL